MEAENGNEQQEIKVIGKCDVVVLCSCLIGGVNGRMRRKPCRDRKCPNAMMFTVTSR